jgi:DNA-binding response OmpR family regulator
MRTEGVLERATRFGVVATLAKPFSPKELLVAVRTTLLGI